MNLKKVIALIAVAVMAIGVTQGCGVKPAQSPPAGQESAAKTELIMYTGITLASVPKDSQMVIDEINKLLENDINATLKMEFFPFNESSTKIPLLFSSGENFDVIVNAEYTTNASKGAYLDITDMLKEVTPNLVNKYSELAWKGVTINGRIYTVPGSNSVPFERVMLARGDVLKRSGMTSIGTLEDLDKFLRYVKDNEPELNPFEGTPWDFECMCFSILHSLHGFSSMDSGEEASGLLGFFNLKDPEDYKVYSWEEITDEYLVPYFKKMYEMQQAELWPKGILQNTANSMTLMYDGKTSLGITTVNAIGSNPHRYPDYELTAFPFYDFQYVNTRIYTNGLSINKGSKNPEKALMLIERLTNYKEYHDLSVFGIENVHYQIMPDGSVLSPLEGVNPDDDPFPARGWGSWMWEQRSVVLNRTNNSPQIAELHEKHASKASKHPFCAFLFDVEPVKNEYAAVSDVSYTYGPPLWAGLVDPDEIMPEFKQKMKEAGVDKLYDEVVRQAELYVSGN